MYIGDNTQEMIRDADRHLARDGQSSVQIRRTIEAALESQWKRTSPPLLLALSMCARALATSLCQLLRQTSMMFSFILEESLLPIPL